MTANLGDQLELDGNVSLDLWFDGVPPASAYEEVLHLGTYGRTLTVLSAEPIEPEEEMEERMKKYFT